MTLHSIPGVQSLLRLSQQLLAINPFDGDSRPTRVPLFRARAGGSTLVDLQLR